MAYCIASGMTAKDVLPINSLLQENLHSHMTVGHFGLDKTLANIKRRFYWPSIREEAERWIKSCDICARVMPSPGRGRAALHQFKVNAIMQCVAVDILGPLPIFEKGNVYIIVLEDYFAKWVEAWPVPNHTVL